MRAIDRRWTVGISVVAVGALLFEPAFAIAMVRFLQRLILEPVIVSIGSAATGLLAGFKWRAARLRPNAELRTATKAAYRDILNAYSEGGV